MGLRNLGKVMLGWHTKIPKVRLCWPIKIFRGDSLPSTTLLSTVKWGYFRPRVYFRPLARNEL